jgi:hypothetical protein
VAIAGNQDFSAVACADGVMHIYSRAGRRLLPAILLPGKVALLEASEPPGKFLLAVTCEGSMHVWDMGELCECYSVPLAPVLRGPENAREFSVTSAWVTPLGAAVIAVSNGFCYSYDQVRVHIDFSYRMFIREASRVAVGGRHVYAPLVSCLLNAQCIQGVWTARTSDECEPVPLPCMLYCVLAVPILGMCVFDSAPNPRRKCDAW